MLNLKGGEEARVILGVQVKSATVTSATVQVWKGPGHIVMLYRYLD